MSGGDDTNLLADPQRLADEGRFDEAIHMLLLIAIRHLGGDLPVPPSPSSTSRELLRALPWAQGIQWLQLHWEVPHSDQPESVVSSAVAAQCKLSNCTCSIEHRVLLISS